MITQARLRELLSYDRQTGALTWKRRPDGSRQWNGKWAGKRAGYVTSTGYRLVRIDGKMHLAHRLIWLMEYGCWPEEVDHQDHNRDNNALSNLAEVDRTGNSKNHSLRSNNTSGHVGVHWFKRVGLWNAYIAANGKRISLGYFKVFEDAVAARRAANDDFGYHRNHGKSQ